MECHAVEWLCLPESCLCVLGICDILAVSFNYPKFSLGTEVSFEWASLGLVSVSGLLQKLQNLCGVKQKAYCKPCKEQQITSTDQNPPNRW